MQLIAVCTGLARPLAHKRGQTGIDKRPVEGRVSIGPLGLGGDQVMNRKYHGGPDQAVYIYTQPDYDFWEQQLGRPLRAGEFGENLVVSGLESAAVGIGQRIQVGKVVLEATAARMPCGTFSQHMNDLSFARKFRDARRPGLYARVIVPGEVQAGDEVRLGEVPAGTPTVLDTYEFFYNKRPAPEQLQWLLSAPVATRLRADLLKAQGALESKAAQQAQR